MANRRKASKKNVGGYLDEALKDCIKKTGIDETGFIEWSLVRGLLERHKLTKKEVAEMAREGRLKPSTILMLQHDGQLETEL